MNHFPIQHLLVLMLENRSFDHLLGYLDYPADTPFEGLRGREQKMGNSRANGQQVFPRSGASYFIDPGPDHSHAAVMRQLLGKNPPTSPYQLTNDGFAEDYDTLSAGHGEAALQCFTPDRLPVLSTLAQQFTVCDHWFCSVPGATWPNRNFAHAATSGGEVDIHLRWYYDQTIYELLSAAGRDWAVYYGGFPPQTIAFKNLWSAPGHNWLQRFKPVNNLYRAIQYDRLPHYAFIEPDMLGKTSDSQHPGMGGEMDFRAAERLIWRIYTALRSQPQVFEKTALLITYDEHGGFFDHVPPPQGPEWAVDPPYQDPDKGYTFSFDLLGPRVPAVLVSPWTPAGSVDQTIYDHASIPATVRRIFGISTPLTARDAHANTFDRNFSLPQPRRDLPEVEEPLVDESLRALAQGLELRESLAWIVRDLIWRQIRVWLAEGSSTPGTRDLEAGLNTRDEASIDEKVTAQIIEEVGAQLSTQARQIVSEEEVITPAPGDELDRGLASESLSRAVKIIRHKIERLLENQELVDDAMLLADWFVRKFESRLLILHAGDSVLENPSAAGFRAALEELYSKPGLPQVWLADHKDRWLVFYPDQRLEFYDQDPAHIYRKQGVNVDSGFQLFQELAAGRLSTVRAFFSS